MSGDIVINKLDDLLRPHLQPNEAVIKHQTKPFTTVGDNFGSCIVSVDVTIANEENHQQRILHLVNKMMPQDPMIFTVFNPKAMHIKEMDFYLKAVPAMLKLQQDNSVPEEDWISNIVPKCYGGRIGFGSEVDNDAAILLENLKYRGYEMKDKRIGLDFEHARLVLQKLAIIHALPMALKRKRPDEYDNTVAPAARLSAMNENDPNEEKTQQKYNEVNVNILRKLPLDGKRIDRAIKTFTVKNLTYVEELKDPFVSIVHNDLWINNIIFIPDEVNKELPGGLAILDFQLTRLNSPLCDVVFFLFSSVDTNVRRKHFDELIDAYHVSFTKCLRQVGCDISEFTKAAVLAEMNRVAGSRLCDVSDGLRIMLADKSDVVNEEWVCRTDLGGDEYVRKVSDVINDFDERGWLPN